MAKFNIEVELDWVDEEAGNERGCNPEVCNKYEKGKRK